MEDKYYEKNICNSKRTLRKIDHFVARYVDHDWLFYNKYDGE